MRAVSAWPSTAGSLSAPEQPLAFAAAGVPGGAARASRDVTASCAVRRMWDDLRGNDDQERQLSDQSESAEDVAT